MIENGIFIVSDNQMFIDSLKEKIVLLREIDNVLFSNYKNAIKFLNENNINLILTDGENPEITKDFIKDLKANIRYKNTQIITFMDFYNDEFALELFDIGINDFILKSASDSEILMRLVWSIQNFEKKQIYENNQNLLYSLGVIEDQNSGIYSPKYCKQVFENEIKNKFKQGEFASLMMIAPDINCRQKLSVNLLGTIIKKTIRNADILGYAGNYKFYLLLPKTKVKGIFIVYEKIKNALNEEYSISVGATELKSDNFSEVDACVNKALDEALGISDSIIIANNISTKPQTENWLEKINSNQKNFKLFKQTFMKKLKNVITPTFYQMQKLYEEKLFETQINQYSNETQSVFELKNDDFISVLKITYPGFSKINIDIDHGFSKEPLQRTSLDLNKLSDDTLSKMLEKFIREYRKEYNKK